MLAPVWSVMATSGNKTNNLFFMERSKNKNVVQYDVQLMENNDLREPKPVIVYWILENGKHEELSGIQKKYAYGIDSQKKIEKNKFKIVLVALEKRDIIVKKIKGSYKAIISIEASMVFSKSLYKIQRRFFRYPQSPLY